MKSGGMQERECKKRTKIKYFRKNAPENLEAYIKDVKFANE